MRFPTMYGINRTGTPRNYSGLYLNREYQRISNELSHTFYNEISYNFIFVYMSKW